MLNKLTFSEKATRFIVAFLLLLSVALLTASLVPVHSQEAGNTPEKNEGSTKSHFYFATGDEFGTPATESKTSFNCTDKVYLVAELRGLPNGKHVFTVLWRDPNDDLSEKTEYDFNVTQAESKLWAWLKLSRARGAGMLTWINPAAGLEEFIGEWSVEVLVNQKRVSKESFTVVC